MTKYYYELKWPESLPDSQRNCEHIDEKELINKALDRLQDGVMESEIAYGKIDDINLLNACKEIITNQVADFDTIKFAALQTIYLYDDQLLVRVDNKDKLDPVVNRGL